MTGSKGFFLAGGLFMLAGAIQMASKGGIGGGAFFALGAAFIALGANKKKSEGGEK